MAESESREERQTSGVARTFMFDPVSAVHIENELVHIRVVNDRLGTRCYCLALLRDYVVDDPVETLPSARIHLLYVREFRVIVLETV